MKIALIGAPGSGKTHIARYIAEVLDLQHIECDHFYWRGLDVRSEVSALVEGQRWILDGHISKVSDIVLPVADKVIVIEGLRMRSLFRSLVRDWTNPSKLFFNIQNYERMASKRQELIDGLLKSRKQDVLFLNNFPDLSESKLAAFCEDLKTASVKTNKQTIKRQRS